MSCVGSGPKDAASLEEKRIWFDVAFKNSSFVCKENLES